MPNGNDISELENFEYYLNEKLKGENEEKTNNLFFGRVKWN